VLVTCHLSFVTRDRLPAYRTLQVTSDK
jgi:hypothetical protein